MLMASSTWTVRCTSTQRRLLRPSRCLHTPHWSELVLAGATVALHPGRTGGDSDTGLGFEVDDLDTTLELAVSVGGRITEALRERPEEGIRVRSSPTPRATSSPSPNRPTERRVSSRTCRHAAMSPQNGCHAPQATRSEPDGVGKSPTGGLTLRKPEPARPMRLEKLQTSRRPFRQHLASVDERHHGLGKVLSGAAGHRVFADRLLDPLRVVPVIARDLGPLRDLLTAGTHLNSWRRRSGGREGAADLRMPMSNSSSPTHPTASRYCVNIAGSAAIARSATPCPSSR